MTPQRPQQVKPQIPATLRLCVCQQELAEDGTALCYRCAWAAENRAIARAAGRADFWNAVPREATLPGSRRQVLSPQQKATAVLWTCMLSVAAVATLVIALLQRS